MFDGMTMTRKIKRPVLRYHGGKWLLAPWIIEHFPAHKKYVEPFGGGGSVLLQKGRSDAEVYNDLDGAIVNLFRILRNREQTEKLQWLLERTPYSRTEHQDAYEPSDDPVEQARRILIRSWMSISTVGACRKSRTGFAIDDIACDRYQGIAANLPIAAERLLGVMIENRPAIRVIECFDRSKAWSC